MPARNPTDLRNFHHSDFTIERLAADRELSVSVCLPSRETAGTVGAIVTALLTLCAAGVIDEVVVIDAASEDGTADVAERAGAEVHQEAYLLPEHGPVLGKGDAMWRALSVLRSDVVLYLDSDSHMFGPHFACGLLGPLLLEEGISFAKASYRRPFTVGQLSVPDAGGRVSALTARPLLTMFYPELAAIRQPLAGEIAARRDLLVRLPFATGYAVEVAMLIDAYREVGLDGLVQVDLDVRFNEHQSLSQLSGMAWDVLGAVTARLEREGRLSGVEPGTLLVPDGDQTTEKRLELIERPPFASLTAADAS
jgi:glucosyl-3-phosphoglycerate synthase